MSPEEAKKLAENITKGEVMTCGFYGCKGPVKPDITFFGEALPKYFQESLDKIEDDPVDLDNTDPAAPRKYPDGGCDLMIVIGTALAVGPFNTSVNCITSSTPCILFNMESSIPRENGYDF